MAGSRSRGPLSGYVTPLLSGEGPGYPRSGWMGSVDSDLPSALHCRSLPSQPFLLVLLLLRVLEAILPEGDVIFEHAQE